MKSRKFEILPSTEEQEETVDREFPPLMPNLNFEYESEIWQLIKDVSLIEGKTYNIKLPNLRVYVNTLYKDGCFYVSKNKKIDKDEVEFCYLVS